MVKSSRINVWVRGPCNSTVLLSCWDWIRRLVYSVSVALMVRPLAVKLRWITND